MEVDHTIVAPVDVEPVIVESTPRSPYDPNNSSTENVLEALTTFAFGNELYDDFDLMEKLKEGVMQMSQSLSRRQSNDISASIAAECVKRLWQEKKLHPQDFRLKVFMAALIMLYYPRVPQDSLMETTTQLFEKYPEFRDTDAAEAQNLLRFRNYMAAACILIDAKKSKNLLLDLVARVSEGKAAKYVTGSGETIGTSRRVRIYRKESGILPVQRSVKTKAEREAIAALACSSAGLLSMLALRNPENSDESDYVDTADQPVDIEEDNELKSLGEKRAAGTKRKIKKKRTCWSRKTPPKKRNNHRRLDGFDILLSPDSHRVEDFDELTSGHDDSDETSPTPKSAVDFWSAPADFVTGDSPVSSFTPMAIQAPRCFQDVGLVSWDLMGTPL